MARFGSQKEGPTRSGASHQRRNYGVLVPTLKGFPWAITSGPDKTIWFTERIGKIGKAS